MQKRAILYLRVSTDEQADRGYSLPHQEEVLQRYCSMNNIEVVAIFKEDHSAKTFDRPEWSNLLRLVKKSRGTIDYILFIKWDRFSRNVADAYGMISILNRNGVEPQAIEQPLDMTIPENKIMLAFYLAAPEVENDRRALNVTAGMRRAKKEGRWMATAPKGYRNARDEQNRKVIVPSKDANFIIEAFELINKNIYTIEEVRKKLCEKGFICSKNNFHKLIRNSVYCGIIKIPANKTEEETTAKGQHQPLISEELFWSVQDILEGRRPKHPVKHTRMDKLPLRGFLICPKCGTHLTGSASRGKMGKRYFYYHCNSSCGIRYRSENVNNDFVKEIEKIQAKEESIELYYEVMKTLFKKNGKDHSKEVNKITEEIGKLKERLNKAQEMMLDGGLDTSDYREIKKRYEDNINQLIRNRNSLEQVDHNFDAYLGFTYNLLKNLTTSYVHADLEVKQMIVSSIYPEKLVYENNQFRTPKINDALSLIYSNEDELQKMQMGLRESSSLQSHCVTPRGFEPPTNRTGICHSIQLNYGVIC